MTLRVRWVLGLVVTAASVACSSSSSSTPPAGDDAEAEQDATPADATPVADAATAPMCDAVSLAVIDAGATACFQCLASKCASALAACSTDCACAPVYNCLQANSVDGLINSGYSACPDAVSAIMNSNAALTSSTNCATTMCKLECFGDGG